MVANRKPAFFYLLLASLFVLLGCCRAQWKPQDVIRINCGASSATSDWQPDSNKVVTSGVSAKNPNSSSPTPYDFARILTSPGTYSFSISPGRHWVRLYFSRFSAPQLPDPRFSVSIGSRILIHNTTITDDAAFFTEFTIHTSGTALSITFTPEGPNSSALISGIELVSMARDSISPNVAEISSEEQFSSRQIEVPAILARTVVRLNVGGELVSPRNDSAAQGRTWLPDEPYLEGVVRGTDAPPTVSDITYPSTVPDYIAPREVYGTARTLGQSNTSSNLFNLSWVFSVHPDYSHYVRLHFAEIVYSAAMVRIFSVYINNRTAVRALDLVQQTGGANIPYYRDFVVVPGLANLRLQIGPLISSGSQFQDAILNGVELFRLNDSSGHVDGLSAGVLSPRRTSDSGSKAGIIAGSVAGGLLAVVLGLLLFCCCRRKKTYQKPAGGGGNSSWHPIFSHSVLSETSGAGSYYNAGSITGGGGGHGRYFTFQEIVEATNGFDESRLLGVGGFGRVYKGEIDNGTMVVAVKRGNPRSEQGIAEFQAEIGLLSKLRHRHLVSLIGYCDEQSEMILVYEYMAQGPLRGHLYGPDQPPSPLTWRQRLEIVVGAARGLHYLHTGADHARAIIHRDVKTTNILLDEQLVAKVSDFGLSKTGPNLDQTHVSTAVKGSFGYLDPEYFRRQQLTDKSDVYSFGVVLVEVMCARPAIDPSLPREQVNIAEWAMAAKRSGRLEQILDPRLRRPGSEDDADMESVYKVAETAEKCLQEYGAQRPSMGDVLWNLESALHMQEAAQRRFKNGNGGGNNVDVVNRNGNGNIEMVNRNGVENGHGNGDAVNRSNHTEVNLVDDYYDGYSEDASASAVFSQLVNPQGR